MKARKNFLYKTNGFFTFSILVFIYIRNAIKPRDSSLFSILVFIYIRNAIKPLIFVNWAV